MKINEIFYSIQGEGFHAGTPAIFIRFSGCNLKCPFCDTKHQEGIEMSINDILMDIVDYKAGFVVLTGGEPSLQVTSELIEELHNHGYYVATETNGTKELPIGIDWVTCSPKGDWERQGEKIVNRHYNEVKVVNDGKNDVDRWLSISSDNYYLQPCDTGDKDKNQLIIEDTIKKCLDNPIWKISLQTQKILNVR